jgi:hypothetical protein
MRHALTYDADIAQTERRTAGFASGPPAMPARSVPSIRCASVSCLGPSMITLRRPHLRREVRPGHAERRLCARDSPKQLVVVGVIFYDSQRPQDDHQCMLAFVQRRLHRVEVVHALF